MVHEFEGGVQPLDDANSNGAAGIDEPIVGPRSGWADARLMQRVVLRLLLAPGDSVRERSLIDAVAAQSVESDSGLVRSFQIVRRCVTASEALAGLETGQADVALLGTDLHGLSADVLRAITRTG